MESNKVLHAIVIGATGATGRELVDLLLKSKKWTSVTVVARRTIGRWDKFSDNERLKFKLIQKEDLIFLNTDNIEELKTIFTEKNYSSVFCCLGTTKNNDKAEVKNVNYDYSVYSSGLAEKLKIPHFSQVSLSSAKIDSWAYIVKMKAEADEAARNKKIDYVSILKPGMILNRDNYWRFSEWISKFIPFIPKVEVTDIAKAMIVDANDYHEMKIKEKRRNISNSEIKLYAKQRF